MANGTSISISGSHPYLKRGLFTIRLTGIDSGGAAAMPASDTSSAT